MSDHQIIIDSTNNSQISLEDLKVLLKELSNPNNSVRNKSEEILTNFSKELWLYKYLLHIFNLESEEKYFRVQSILLIKNLLRLEFSSQIIKSKTDSGKIKFILYLPI